MVSQVLPQRPRKGLGRTGFTTFTVLGDRRHSIPHGVPWEKHEVNRRQKIGTGKTLRPQALLGFAWERQDRTGFE